MNKLNTTIRLAAFIAAAVITFLTSGCLPAELIGSMIEADSETESRRYSETELKSKALEVQKEFDGYGYKALLNDAERELYALVDINANRTVPQEFPIEKSIEKNISNVIEMYKNDHPEVFWLNDNYNYEYREENERLYINLLFSVEGEELEKAKKLFDNSILDALENAPHNGSDYEKELYVNDYLINRCEYDEKAAETKEVIGFEQTAYGSLVDGKAVCEGYTRAFQLLCGRLGVECVPINGICEDTGSVLSGNHIWNAAKIDGDWYQVDVTWNDFTTNEEDYFISDVETHLYFNLTTDEICEDHTINPIYGGKGENIFFNSFVPECDSTEYNYFDFSVPVLNDPENCEDLKNLLTSAAANGEDAFEFTVSDSLDFDYAVDEIVNGYAYEWFSCANELNDSTHQLSDSCKVYTYDEIKVIVLKLDYI